MVDDNFGKDELRETYVGRMFVARGLCSHELKTLQPVSKMEILNFCGAT